jgi:hypothetical protein
MVVNIAFGFTLIVICRGAEIHFLDYYIPLPLLGREPCTINFQIPNDKLSLYADRLRKKCF